MNSTPPKRDNIPVKPTVGQGNLDGLSLAFCSQPPSRLCSLWLPVSVPSKPSSLNSVPIATLRKQERQSHHLTKRTVLHKRPTDQDSAPTQISTQGEAMAPLSPGVCSSHSSAT